MACRCGSRGSASWALPTWKEFTAPYDLVEPSDEGWVALYRCSTCGAHWVIEKGGGHERGRMVAVRVPSANKWENADMVDARRQLLVAERGESERPCRWRGCEQRALVGMEICVDHAYRLPKA